MKTINSGIKQTPLQRIQRAMKTKAVVLVVPALACGLYAISMASETLGLVNYAKEFAVRSPNIAIAAAQMAVNTQLFTWQMVIAFCAFGCFAVWEISKELGD